MHLDEIVSLTEELCTRAGFAVEKIDGEQVDERTIRVTLQSADSALLIGRNGETLFALQHMLRLILKRRSGADASHVIVDVNGYRREQEENAMHVAADVAAKVRASGVAFEFPPMLSYKRRAIHTYFADAGFEDLSAFSVGEGLQRRIRVEPKLVANIDADLGI